MTTMTTNAEKTAVPWHARELDEVLAELASRREGLTDEEAEQRLKRHGPNELPQEEGESALKRFLRQFNDVLIYILLAAALLTAFLGEWIDSGVILAVVLVNAVIGFMQEGRAEAALASIRAMLSLEATVRRGGERRTIPARELVVGDVVLLESGDRVPADLRIFRANNLRIEEAALTGESVPVEKGPAPVAEGAVLGDRSSMAYSGTTVTSGRLEGVVVATGVETEIGRIGAMVAQVETLTTPLLRAIKRFGKALSFAIVGLAAALFGFGFFFRDFTLVELFMIVVSLAVAAIPEGLPAIMTITLALGVQRMARRNAIIRRLPAVETLGSVTIICSDKTGTLTRNEMTVGDVLLPGEHLTVSGVGYAPEGNFSQDGVPLDPQNHERLTHLALATLLCSDASVRRQEDGWRLEGDPTEGAVVVLALKAGLSLQERARYPRLDEIPFESEHRFMATLHEMDDKKLLCLKGAPEVVLERCSHERRADGDAPLDESYWLAQIDRLAEQGKRVLAVAVKEGVSRLDFDEVEGGLTLLGFVGMIDPPRPEAIEAVRECQQAGIRVKMITGDHALTARSIGAALGIGDGEKALTGSEIEEMDDAALRRAVLEYDVFARSSPEHKLRLVEALQVHGEVVAMTGDGVNDAPALKRADVGVAMGIKGSEAAKDAADMVLADDNFVSIERAVEEGRTIYDNLKKTILFILPTNGAEALIVLTTVVFAFATLPITPVQILWVNMITAVTLALALAFEPTEAGIMRRPPRDPEEPILSGYLLWRIAFVSSVIAGLALFFFFRYLEAGASIEHARTVALNVLVAGQLFYLFNTRFIMRASLSWEAFTSNRAALVAVSLLIVFQLALSYAPPLQLWFGTAPLGLSSWLWIVAAGVMIFLVVELEKGVARLIRR
jgi:magnesium-transporting ATPase (P-type)